MTEEEARRIFPKGQRVAYQPVAGQPQGEQTTIRSEPWTLGSGHVVVAIEGRAGGVSVDHLIALKD